MHFRPRLTRLENRDVPTTMNLFDAAFYLRHNPDVAAAVARGDTTAEQHFRTFGDAEGRSGNPIFDTGFYLATNDDVLSASVVAHSITPFAHFEQFGQFELRDPSIDFKTADYLDLYRDVRAEVINGRTTAFEHFNFNGQFEGRLPLREFARRDYINDNPDVAAAFNNSLPSAVAHWEQFGRHENRKRPVGNFVDWPTTAPVTFTGHSNNSNDPQLFAFAPPVSGFVTVAISFTGDLPRASVENTTTNVPMYQRAFVDTGLVQLGPVAFEGGTTYVLRVRSNSNAPSDFTVTLNVNS